jgi:hypothetical protein
MSYDTRLAQRLEKKKQHKDIWTKAAVDGSDPRQKMPNRYTNHLNGRVHNALQSNTDINELAQFIDINIDIDLFKRLFKEAGELDFSGNVYGKVEWMGYSLEGNYWEKDRSELIRTEYIELFKPILDIMAKVHPDKQLRSTGFNYTEGDQPLFVHSDIDWDLEHPNAWNIIIPIFGSAKIVYYETREEEVHLPEKNQHGHAYYHEFKKRPYLYDVQRGMISQKEYDKQLVEYEEFKASRKIGEIFVEPGKPVILDTNTMHGVDIVDGPRLAWCHRWNNIPEGETFWTWKNRVETILQ